MRKFYLLKGLPLHVLFLLLYQNSFSQFVVNGVASEIGNACYQLTPYQGYSVGSIWFEEKVSLETSFTIHVRLNFGDDNVGADGITFTLQPVDNTIGVLGGGIGVGGINPSVIIEFDTWQNVNFGDPVFDHVAIMRNGILNHTTVNNLAGPVNIVQNQNNVKNGADYPITIKWDAAINELSVEVNCVAILSYSGDIVNEIFNGNPDVFWGLQQQQVVR